MEMILPNPNVTYFFLRKVYFVDAYSSFGSSSSLRGFSNHKINMVKSHTKEKRKWKSVLKTIWFFFFFLKNYRNIVKNSTRIFEIIWVSLVTILKIFKSYHALNLSTWNDSIYEKW